MSIQYSCPPGGFVASSMAFSSMLIGSSVFMPVLKPNCSSGIERSSSSVQFVVRSLVSILKLQFSRAIPLYALGSVGLPFPLKRVLRSDFRQLSGMVLDDRHLFINDVHTLAKKSFDCFSCSLEIPSGPVVFLLLCFASVFITSSRVNSRLCSSFQCSASVEAV